MSPSSILNRGRSVCFILLLLLKITALLLPSHRFPTVRYSDTSWVKAQAPSVSALWMQSVTESCGQQRATEDVSSRCYLSSLLKASQSRSNKQQAHICTTAQGRARMSPALPRAPSSCRFSLNSALWQVSKQLVIHQLKALPSAARVRRNRTFSGRLCAQAAQALCSRSPCGRALTKLAASSKYKVSLQFPASRETQAPRTMDTCQTIAVIQGHFRSPNWRLLAPVHTKYFAISQKHW